MPTMIVIGYRPDLDRAIRRRDLDPYYIVPAPVSALEKQSYSCVADMENVQEVLRAVLSAELKDVVGALSVHEMGVFGAAFLRQQLNLPGHADPRRVLSFRDKYLQKRDLPPQVERARCRYATKDTAYADLVDELGDVFVVKPAAGAGSLRTNIVRSPEAYAKALDQLPGQSDVAIVAESFVAAPEVYLDGIWADGGLQWSSVSRYHASPVSAAQGGILAAHLVDKKRHAALSQQLETLAGQVLGHLEAPDCVFHLEAFRKETGLTFGECAIRLPGGLSPQANELTYGVDLFDIEIGLALGEKPIGPLGTASPDRYYGYALLRPSSSGRLTQEDFEQRFSLDDIKYDGSLGAHPGPYGSVGHALVSDQDDLKLQKTIEEIVRFNEDG
ncbi:acetyl-CoA carboxylase biotin carboxylase subunit family protein [Streptomyces sp. NPDC053499]|uniref:acetyl-CoA carboxylase biotin carboxylase subunit family protein n=1 Tax=Streptomyces sp. NPDC053499 TaxID=3365707 RepID=UPI0037CDA4BE